MNNNNIPFISQQLLPRRRQNQQRPAQQRPAQYSTRRPTTTILPPIQQHPAPIQQHPAPIQQHPAPIQQHPAPIQRQAPIQQSTGNARLTAASESSSRNSKKPQRKVTQQKRKGQNLK